MWAIPSQLICDNLIYVKPYLNERLCHFIHFCNNRHNIKLQSRVNVVQFNELRALELAGISVFQLPAGYIEQVKLILQSN